MVSLKSQWKILLTMFKSFSIQQQLSGEIFGYFKSNQGRLKVEDGIFRICWGFLCKSSLILPILVLNVPSYDLSYRFDEDLTKSVSMNIGAVATVLALAKKMTKLVSIIDVSTAYCNCDLQEHANHFLIPTHQKYIIDNCKKLHNRFLPHHWVKLRFACF